MIVRCAIIYTSRLLQRGKIMKKSLFRFAVLLLAAVFLMTTIACEQPGTPNVPPSSEDKPNPTPEPIPEPEPEPEPDPMSIWDIQSFDDLLKFATGSYTVDPENLPTLGEEEMSVALQAAKGILLADTSILNSGDRESIMLELYGKDGEYGKMIFYRGAETSEIWNGEITYGGNVLRMVDCVIDYEWFEPYLVSGSILLNGVESDFDTANRIIEESSAEFFDYYSVTNIEQENATYSFLQTDHVAGEDSNRSDTLYYTTEVDGKTVTVAVKPFYIHPYGDRRIEYIAIDEVLYNAAGVAESIFSGIQSVSIYNDNDDEIYKTGNDAVITTEPENIFLFYPVTEPDIDAAYLSAFSWSLTDSEGNPSDAATITPGEKKGLLILTAVHSGNCTLTLTSKVKPELSCSVAIVIEEPAAEPAAD